MASHYINKSKTPNEYRRIIQFDVDDDTTPRVHISFTTKSIFSNSVYLQNNTKHCFACVSDVAFHPKIFIPLMHLLNSLLTQNT